MSTLLHVARSVNRLTSAVILLLNMIRSTADHTEVKLDEKMIALSKIHV